MNEPVKNARKPRLTVEDAWPYSRQLLVLAEPDDKRDILTGARNAEDRAVLIAKATKYEALAADARAEAEICIDHREAVLETLRKRAAELTK